MQPERGLVVALNICQAPCVARCVCPFLASGLGTSHLQDRFQALATLRQVFSWFPEPVKRQTQTQRPFRMVMGDQPIESRSEIVVVDIAQSQPVCPFRGRERRVAFFGQYHAVGGVRPLSCLFLPAGSQPLQPILPNGLEHRKASLSILLFGLLQQALVQQRPHPFPHVNLEVLSRVADSLSCFERASARKNRNPSEQL